MVSNGLQANVTDGGEHAWRWLSTGWTTARAFSGFRRAWRTCAAATAVGNDTVLRVTNDG
jgi:hypothetical protein